MILDDPDSLRAADISGALDQLFSYPEQLEHLLANFPTDIAVDGDLDHVLFVAYGASYTAARVASALAYSESSIPVGVTQDARLPGYIGPRSLVVLVSYSGHTQECWVAYADALKRGARIAVVTSGGDLAANTEGTPCVSLCADYASDYALPSLVFGCVKLLEIVGVLHDQQSSIDEAHQLMKRQRAGYAPGAGTAENAAKMLATSLRGRLPVFYGSVPQLSPVVDHWRARINSAGKRQAHAGTFPEMTHNELLGWRSAKMQSSNWAIVAVRDPDDSVGESARVEAALDSVPCEIPVHDVFVDGSPLLAKLWTGLYFAEIVSAYLSLASGEQPSSV